jgi:hypothetical protein
MTDLSLREQIADIVVCHTGHALNGLEYSETDAADAILELIKGPVKPLEWMKIGSEWHSITDFGLYLVSPMNGGGWGVWYAGSYIEGAPDLFCETDDEAKADGNSENARRILAALGVK